jgi:hypothetical protein
MSVAFAVKAEVRDPRAKTFLAKQPLGRSELKHLTNWTDGRPGTELNFKFYRQATNKIVGISEAAAAFLRGFF